MLESGVRVLVPVLLLAGASSNCLWAAGPASICWTAETPTVESDNQLYSVNSGDPAVWSCRWEARLGAGSLLEPPVGAGAVLSSSPLPSLPAIPKSILMALVGFLCVSLVRDGKVWLAVAASLLPLGHYRPNAVALLSSPPQGEKSFGYSLSRGIFSIPCERVSLCVPVYAASHGSSDRTGWDVMPAVAGSRSPWNELSLCLASDLSPTWSVSSPFVLAQVARGPPRWPPRTPC